MEMYKLGTFKKLCYSLSYYTLIILHLRLKSQLMHHLTKNSDCALVCFYENFNLCFKTNTYK